MTAMAIPDRIKVILASPHEGAFKQIPVRIGVPLPKGWLGRSETLVLRPSHDEKLPVQKRVLARWSDGSPKWMLVDFFTPPQVQTRMELFFSKQEEEAEKLEGDDILRVEPDSDGVCTIHTGKATFSLDVGGDRIFKSIVIDGREFLDSHKDQIFFCDADGKALKIRIDRLSVEDRGPLTCTIRGQGSITGKLNRPVARLSFRLQFFKGLAAVKMEVGVHNPKAARHPGGIWDLGDAGSIFFSEFGLRLPGCESMETLSYAATIGQSPVTLNTSDWLLYQDSSGGENWNSNNHITHTGQLSVQSRGYTITSGKTDEPEILEHGDRAQPLVKLTGRETWICVGVEHFWQNFPKSIEVAGNTIGIGLFPRQAQFPFELQGGEKKRHRLYFQFGTGPEDITVADLLSPPQVHVDPDWTAATGAVAGFVPQSADRNQGYLDYIKNAVDGAHSFFNKREVIDEFGWRHYGDVYADHEAVFSKTSHPLISHYNNQYDLVFGAIVRFLIGGDQRWRDLAFDYANHVIDIDIYHTDLDKAGYNHGLFWHTDHYRDAGTCSHRSFTRQGLDPKKRRSYGGGPCNENNYTTGLMFYYFLTGDRDAFEAVLELAQWVMDMDDGRKTIFNFIDDGPTGLASQTVSTDFHKPGRGAGNSINALMDAYQITGRRAYLDKAEDLIARCIHPHDNIEAMTLDEPEYRWSYLVFLQSLAKYLDMKFEMAEQDYAFFHARDSLLHYADWMLINEVPYNKVLDKVEIPTETWPAQDIRKCCVLHYASKYGRPEKRTAFSEKAGFFFCRCLSDLLTYDTAYLTRPMVLLINYGYYQAYFQNTAPSVPFQEHCHDFGGPMDFKAQRARLKESIILKTKVLAGFSSRALLAALDRIQRGLLIRRTR